MWQEIVFRDSFSFKYLKIWVDFYRFNTEFLTSSTIDTWGRIILYLDGYTSQDVWQLLWLLPSRCHQHSLFRMRQSKVTSGTGKCFLGAKPFPVENHSFKPLEYLDSSDKMCNQIGITNRYYEQYYQQMDICMQY